MDILKHFKKYYNLYRFLIVVGGLFLLTKGRLYYAEYHLKKETHEGYVINKEKRKGYPSATYITLSNGDWFYLDFHIYDSTRIGDYLIKKKGTADFLLARNGDTILFHSILDGKILLND